MRPQSEFFCTTAWHFARFKSKVAHLVYEFACGIAHKSERFYSSPEQVAGYFGFDDKTVRSAYKELVETGWFMLIAQGYYSPNTYQVILNHDEWAKAHPDQCCEKMVFAWTAENDRLGQALWSACNGQIRPKKHIVKALRKFIKERSLSEQEIVREFESWFPNQCHAHKYVMGHFIKHCRTKWTGQLQQAA